MATKRKNSKTLINKVLFNGTYTSGRRFKLSYKTPLDMFKSLKSAINSPSGHFEGETIRRHPVLTFVAEGVEPKQGATFIVYEPEFKTMVKEIVAGASKAMIRRTMRVKRVQVGFYIVNDDDEYSYITSSKRALMVLGEDGSHVFTPHPQLLSERSMTSGVLNVARFAGQFIDDVERSGWRIIGIIIELQL